MKFQPWAMIMKTRIVVQVRIAAWSPVKGTSAIAAKIASPTSKDHSQPRLSLGAGTGAPAANGSRRSAASDVVSDAIVTLPSRSRIVGFAQDAIGPEDQHQHQHDEGDANLQAGANTRQVGGDGLG